MGVSKGDIISFEMTCKLSYKNCDVMVKRYGKIMDLTIINISSKGYIIELNKTFITDSNYHHLFNYLNDNIGFIEKIYQSVIKKGAENDSKIREFG